VAEYERGWRLECVQKLEGRTKRRYSDRDQAAALLRRGDNEISERTVASVGAGQHIVDETPSKQKKLKQE
jgi:hypothetical protein